MASNFIKVPSTETEWLDIFKRFEEKWNFPHALGAIDGKHVRIQMPKNDGSFYYNYKHTHSIILMTIAGPEYECLYADVGSNGRVNNSRIWNKTSLLQGTQGGSVKLPNDEKLPNGEITPYVLLGDDVFALKRFMMEPFPQQGLTERGEYIIIDIVERGGYLKICSEFWLIDGEFFSLLLILNQNMSRMLYFYCTCTAQYVD